MEKIELLFMILPFWVTFAVQLLCCFRVKRKALRHLPVLICVPYVIQLVIHLLNPPAPLPEDYVSPLPGAEKVIDIAYAVGTWMYSFAVVTSILGYGLAWLIYGIVTFFRKKKNNISHVPEPLS